MNLYKFFMLVVCTVSHNVQPSSDSKPHSYSNGKPHQNPNPKLDWASLRNNKEEEKNDYSKWEALRQRPKLPTYDQHVTNNSSDRSSQKVKDSKLNS